MSSRQGKVSFKKVKKKPNFPKGLVHGFCPKMVFSTFVFFPQNKTKKTTSNYFR